jgi:hypothetical protein
MDQAKCPQWLAQERLPKFSLGEVTLSVTDHALVSQFFLQKILFSVPDRLWAVAVGAHHGRPKGKIVHLNAPEALAEWAEENRLHVMKELLAVFGRLWRHERLQRHATTADFWVRLPELSATFNATQLKKALGRTARVYAPYVLLRTAAVWSGRKDLFLPADIRPLLEATYAKPEMQEPEAWQEFFAVLEEEKATLTANATAATRVLGRPMLGDEDDVLTRRCGAPTTPVVLLRSITTESPGFVFVVGLDGSRAEISEHEWRRASARFLHLWLVRTPRWMVPANSPKPRWLTLHGPSGVTVAVVRDDGRCAFGDEVFTATYDPRLGIFAESTAQLTPKRMDDDEFDY